jgi:hypothetical protein
MISIVIVATNSYFLLGLRFVKQWMFYYDSTIPYKIYFFSDKNIVDYIPTSLHNLVTWKSTSHKSWEDATNSKFDSIINHNQEMISDGNQYVYYFDADTTISKPFKPDWFHLKADLTGGEHYNNGNPKKPFDRNPKSKAYIPEDTDRPQMYHYGAFFGGKIPKVVEMCKVLLEWQKEDKKIPYEPIWNDESYLNKYFHYNEHAVVLSKNFPFNISDKSGMEGHYKDTKNNWNDAYLVHLKKDKDCLVFTFNKEQSNHKCKYKLKDKAYD